MKAVLFFSTSFFPFMSTLSEHLADLRVSYAAVKAEDEQRKAITESPEYLALQAQLEAMTSHIPNTREEYEMDKAAILKEMNAQGLLSVEGFATKTRVSKKVDTYSVLQAMDGDIDNLMLVTSITQKSLETFIKDNPSYKRDLKSCIKETGETVTDIIPADTK